MNVAEAELTHAEELAQAERAPRPEKVEEVERLREVLSNAAGVYLTDFRGIDVERMNSLRLRFREAGVNFTIVKNNLLKRAAGGVGLEDWIADLVGPTAMAVGVEDPVAPAKVINEFRDDHKRDGDFLDFKGGLLRGEAIELETFKRLATLPGREELIAKLMYLLKYPITGLVSALSDLPRKLVYALGDLRSKRGGEEPVIAAEEISEDETAAGESPAEEEPSAEETAAEETAAEEAPVEENPEEEIESGGESGPDKEVD